MSSTYIGVTAAVRTALAAQITDAGVDCLPYDTWTRQMGNVATLSANVTREFAIQNGQAHLRTIRLAVLVYTIVAGDVTASLQVGEAAIERVIDAIGSDTTLGSMVSEAMPEGPSTADMYRDENGQMLQVHEVPLAISVLPIAA